MVVGESRSELLNWLNTSLALQYSKIEQCGTGAAYCQLMDSIYGGVALSKVKFDTNLSEYDARNNMKVLQAAFNKIGIAKTIEVERLVKCRLLDNLDLLQWMKRHWKEKKDVNVPYDPVARRQGKPGASGATSGASSRRSTLGTNGTSASISTPASAGTSSRGSRTSSHSSPAATTVQKRRVASANFPNSGVRSTSSDLAQKLADATGELAQARDELNELRVLTDSLETERNFYFNKLRELEILTQNIQDQYERDDATAKLVKQMTVLELTAQIQEILYSTERGFEVQDDMDAESF